MHGNSYGKDVLYRIKKTRPLKEMNGEQRHRNLKGAFAVSKSWNPRQNILLIDDIYTTGSTIECAAGILKKQVLKMSTFDSKHWTRHLNIWYT